MDFPGPSSESQEIQGDNPEDPLPPHHVIINIPESNGSMVYIVREKMQGDVPVAVSLGPYHHRRDDLLELVEPFKDELRNMLCESPERITILQREISERMNEFYTEPCGHSGEDLANMLLRDACFLICFMRGFGEDGVQTYIDMCEHMGTSAMLSVSSDTCMLANQIPLWLISLIYPVQHQSLLCEYLSYRVYGDYRMRQLPWAGEEPRHLLEALHRTFLRRVVETQPNPDNQPREITRSAWSQMDSLFRSVTDLKAKGIYLQPSSNCLTDISFTSYGLFAKLRLPIFCVNEESKVLFSNLIVFEMSAGVQTDYGVSSYINFMKTLINNANDVKVMRERGILWSTLENDEEVLHIFKSISTYGFSSTGLDHFNEVKMRIDVYCNNKARIWMAELFNTYFQSPWSAIALFAAAFLLCLTILQTYYTIHPSTQPNNSI
ncbi:hypothetical protein SASPL_151801 [Salvia splendens]|uniref:Uncharacterized protein n=1 Tax=Salvia splendens TaxID=180675 RepID=A0A8X8W247_SALSN|nr:uncharacterized protein LOC121785281 [Salvia splendens]KAG6386633.1 hypothetical protein SASPL_151801 [Salvia splendens]